MKSFVFYREWLDSISELPVDAQDKIIADIVRCGIEEELAHEQDLVTSAFVNMVRPRIQYSKDKYAERVEASKSAGRKVKISDELILDMAINGKTPPEIAETLGCSVSTVYHSQGWRNRKKTEF